MAATPGSATVTASRGWWEGLGPLLGRYRIDRVLGEGGMARVFAATEIHTHRPVAIKTPRIESFPPDRADELLRRFHREFHAQIQEPIDGVVPVYDAVDVTDADGVVRPLLIMQLLTGGSLGDRLGGRVGARERRQTLGEVIKWLPRIAEALDTLHARGFVHRDVKPDNILFNREGNGFLADFGVVGLLDAQPGMGATIGGSTVGLSPGSPGYQSPESIRADERGSPASDQFSLGVTVYESLAGRLPVDADSIAAWYGALSNWQPTSLQAHCPDLPPKVIAVAMKAIAAHPHERFVTCSEFADALEDAMDRAGKTPSPTPDGSPGNGVGPAPTVDGPAIGAGTPGGSRRRSLKLPAFNRELLYLFVPALLVLPMLAGAALLAYGFDSVFVGGEARETEAARSDDPEAARRADRIEDDAAAERFAAKCTVANFESDDRDHDCEGHIATVTFDPDHGRLGPQEALILDEVAGLLKRNPQLQLELSGHSDTGETLAMGLSERRVRAAQDHLVGQGIDADRLTIAAFGNTQPNVGFHPRRLNRRVDVVVR